MDPNQKLKSFVDQLKGDFQNLKLAIRNVHDLHYVSKCITRKDILLSFLSHFISHPSYVNDFRQFEKPCDTAFLKKILGNNKHDINNNINIIVQLLPVGGNTLKPQQVIRQRLEKETSQWKVSPLREPIRTIVPTVYAPANNQPVATIIIEEVQPMIMEIEGGEYEDEPVVQRAPVNREPIRTIVPTVYAPVNNQPVAAIIIEEVQPMIMEIEGGEYEDDPVVQGVPVNIETHQDIAPEVDAPPLTPIDLLSASGDSIDNDDCWTQSSAFHFFSSVKRKTNNQKEINLSLSSSTEYDEKSGKHLTTIHNKVTFHQEIDMDIEPKNTKRTRDTTNDDSESPNKRPKI